MFMLLVRDEVRLCAAAKSSKVGPNFFTGNPLQ